jgi:hypothetical protein
MKREILARDSAENLTIYRVILEHSGFIGEDPGIYQALTALMRLIRQAEQVSARGLRVIAAMNSGSPNPEPTHAPTSPTAEETRHPPSEQPAIA